MGNRLWKKDKNVKKKRWGYLGEPAIIQLAEFCSFHSTLKTDEQLSNTFESVLLNDYEKLTPAARKRHENALESLRQIVPLLYELRTQLILEAQQQKLETAVESDTGNHLYASLKRHPE